MSFEKYTKEEWVQFIHQLQDDICSALEEMDGEQSFREDSWTRAEGGGGRSRIISHGGVFEKGGVNISEVFGEVTDAMRKQLGTSGNRWFAAGLSLVIHPINPFAPTVHCNYRMFELYDDRNNILDCWFGGGADLTPFYIFEEDARHFHATLKSACDKFDPSLYGIFKKNCDDYFVNAHRGNERRGIGGIFYDYQRPDDKRNKNFWMSFGESCGKSLLPAYMPIIQKRRDLEYDQHQKFWQEIRRGRYVEFNLIHDRGTLFGLKTNGRVESILMSLPPTVRFEYDYKPNEGSPEEKLLQICRHPRDWA
jgi:coproporphyrinogen III oxidase